MRVFCSYSIPLEFFVDRPASCLDIQPEFDETSGAPIFYECDDKPTSVQVCQVSDSRTKMEAILDYEVAERYWAGKDIMQSPLFYCESIQYYETDLDKGVRVHRNCLISYQEEILSNDDRNNEYPYLFLPDAIQDAVDGRMPQKPVEPQPPQKPTGRPVKDSKLSLLLWVPLILISAILIVLSILIHFYGGIFWAIIIGVISGAAIRNKIVSKYDLVTLSEKEQQEKHYANSLRSYEKKFMEYKAALTVYEDCAANYKKKSHAEYVSYLLEVCLDKYTPPVIESNLSVVRQGPAERFFFSYLKERMPDAFEIHDNIRTKHYFRKGGEAYYYPDIALRNKATGLMIDIEIDEPYVAKTGEPIHCLSDDDDRNHALVSDNWIVFRFTEEQIMRFPDICLAYIRTVCSSILTYTGCNKPTSLGFSQKHWIDYESRKMAESNYRLNYLPKDVHKNVYVPPKKEFTTQVEDENLPF